MQESYRYWAFISYSHHDRSWARWLHRRFESYRVPRRLLGRVHAGAEVPRRLYPIFRDRDELPSSADLGGVVQRALVESRFLIVICSARAAASRWVNEEVESFKKLGREDRILCFKIDTTDDCFVPALLQHYDRDGRPTGRATEPLAADATPAADGRDAATLKLIAGMIGVGYDELRRRERRRRLLQRFAAASAALVLVALAAAGWRWQQAEKREALAAQALQTRIERLYQAGRNEMLAHNEARAAVYLNEARRLGVDTPALRYLLARAMQVVDALRLRIATPSPLIQAHLSPDDRQAYGIGADRVLRAYDAHSGRAEYALDLAPLPAFLSGYGVGGRVIWIDSRHQQAPRRRLRLLDAASGRTLAQYTPRDDALGIAVNPLDDSETHVAFIAADLSIVVAALNGGQRRITGQYALTAFCHDDRTLLDARRDGVVELRDAVDGRLRRQFDGLHGRPSVLASTQGCGLIAAGTSDGEVRVWDASSGAVRMSSGHRDPINNLMFSADGSRLLSVAHGAASVWDMRSGALIDAARLLGGGNDLLMRADGREIGQLVGGRLVISDVASGLERYTLDGHQGAPNVFQFAARGDRLISGGADGALLIWSLPDRQARVLGTAPAGYAPPTAVSDDGQSLFAGDASGGSLWTRAPLQRVRRYGEDLGVLSAAAFGAGAQLAIGARDGRVVVVDTNGTAVTHRYTASARPTALHFDAAARYLSADLIDDGLMVWNLSSDEPQLQLAAGVVHASAMASDAPLLAVGEHGVVRLRDLATQSWRWSIRLPVARDADADVTVLAFSADGKRLLATAKRSQAFVLDVGTGRLLSQVRDASSAYFTSGGFDPRGTQAVLGDWANLAYLWRPREQRWRSLSGHTSAVEAVSFTPDGALVLSAGDDGAIRIWDAGNGELLDAFVAHDSLIQWNGARFTPDGGAILSSGRDGSARLWTLADAARDVARVDLELRCRATWRVVGDVLAPRAADASACTAADAQ